MDWLTWGMVAKIAILMLVATLCFGIAVNAK